MGARLPTWRRSPAQDFARLAVVGALAILVGLSAAGDERVRVATYNIKYLNAEVSGTRADSIRKTLSLLEADVVGLQEIDDRAALEAFFPPSEWHLLIDDDSGERQDVALAVHKPFKLVTRSGAANAEDTDFLFSGVDETYFPDRRDVLFAKIVTPTSHAEFYVFVHHAKARVGGRSNTDPRREGAAAHIVARLKHDFRDLPLILLGDLNDSPDDRSANILETGNPGAPAGMEEDPGVFLENLTEPLYARDEVSHGLKSNRRSAENPSLINPVVAGARLVNDRLRGRPEQEDKVNLPILFDQIFVSQTMLIRYVRHSARIFPYSVAIVGNDKTRASDHVPVQADFVFPDAVGGK